MKYWRRAALISAAVATLISFAGKPNEEFRATWVITWNHSSGDKTAAQNKAKIREILDNHVKANMNAVLWQVRQGGGAYYRSSYEPWGRIFHYKDPGFDPLAYAVQEAHKRGLEVHAWMNVFECYGAAEGTPAYEHLDWVCRDGHGNPMPSSIAALSPGLPEVRAYLTRVAMEIVRKYDIDGLHLDYVRWNEFTSSSSSPAGATIAEQQRLYYPGAMPTEEQARKLWIEQQNRYLYDVQHPYSAGVPAGFGSWEDFWRWSVTEFVRTLHDSIQAVKPWVRLSAAVLGRYNWGAWQAYGTVFQDAALWFNEGYVDQLTPMHYHWTTGDQFYLMLRGGCPNCWEQYIRPGIDAGRLYTVGPPSYILSRERIWGRHKQIVERSRDVPWVDGFQFFSYGSWEDHDYWEEAKHLFFQRRTKIRATGLIDSLPPDPPGLQLGKIDSLTYELTILPGSPPPDQGWLALYRSEDDVLDPDSDEIVKLFFSDTAVTAVERFSGTQDFNGRYRYFATALDRYWNESSVSAPVITDSIPSFAPVIVRTLPADGDTVPVNQEIVLQFSKTMDTLSVRAAVQFDPPLAIAEWVWSADHHTLTLVPAANLAFGQSYSLTVSATAADVNGKPLDGNGDGVPGDSYVLHFFTLARDIFGPQIADAYPDLESSTTDFPTDGVLSFAFDELLDRNTVTAGTISLQQADGTDIAFNHLVTDLNSRSILSVQPLQPFATGTDYSVTLAASISDTAGNPMDSSRTVWFRTTRQRYAETVMIDKFLSTSSWWQPNQSGSTRGIKLDGTYFGMSGKAYLPAVPVRQRSAARLQYEWDESKSDFLIRVYLYDGPPRKVIFDTTYTLQCFIFGDGSRNKFRFAVDDSTKDRAEFHEVSRWITIDWYGWRLVEWKLSDPNSVGQWLGDGVLNGTLRFDSFQLTHEPGAAVKGEIFFDNLRLVKKTTAPVSVAGAQQNLPEDFELLPNYPNPFNPETTIPFALPRKVHVELAVFNLLGQRVATLVDADLKPGVHRAIWNGRNALGERVSAGIYICRLRAGEVVLTRKMTLLP